MRKALQIVILMFVSAISLAGEEKPIEQLKAFLKATKTLSADFKQISFDESGNPAQTSYGVFYLQRPGKFRWDYRKPFEQQIISSAGKVWFYDADLEQVTIKKIDQSLGTTPALLLSGEVSLEENFILEQQGVDAGLIWIRLLPKDEQSSFKYILIGMEDGKLGGMELSDNFGQLTRIYFSELDTSVKFDPDVFVFNAPEGVDVFEE